MILTPMIPMESDPNDCMTPMIVIVLGSVKDITDNIGATASDIAYEKGEDEIGNFLTQS